MRTVTLEILRHGPPHNQLLSPLTRYLALCGNHPAETVKVPYEHEEFLRRLRDLRYRESDPSREMTLTRTGRDLSEIFSGIPGLIRELGEYSGDNSEMTHLRLVLNAQELALLPLELILSPNGSQARDSRWRCRPSRRFVSLERYGVSARTRSTGPVTRRFFSSPRRPRTLMPCRSNPIFWLCDT